MDECHQYECLKTLHIVEDDTSVPTYMEEYVSHIRKVIYICIYMFMNYSPEITQ